MRKNKLTHLLEPSLRLYFVFLLLFAAVSALFSVAVAVIEAAVVAVLYLYFRRSNAQRQKEIIKYIESVTCNMDTATKDTMVNAPLPMVIFRPENDEVIWSNDRFLQLTGEREHLFDTKITAAVPDFSSATWSAPRIRAGGATWPPPTGWTSPTSPRCGTSTIPPGRWWGFSPWTTMRS